MAETAFALPQSSFSELRRMIHAYFNADNRSKGEPVSVPDVARLADVDQTTLSRNNGFFTSIRLIEGGRLKKVTDLGRDLGLAISHEDDRLVEQALRRVILESDFLSKVLSAVDIRGGMDLPSLQTHIAISAGAPRTKRTTLGTTSVVQMLLASGRLVDEDGTLRALRSEPTAVDSTDIAETRPESATTQVFESRILRRPTTGSRSGTVTINVNLNVSTDNVEEVVDLLRRLTGLPIGEPREDAES